MSDALVEAFDKIGQPITVGSIVAAPYTKTNLRIQRVEKITPKQLKLEGGGYKYHDEVICLDEIEATVMYLMTQGL